jgi:energy-coupling factor transporter ATP-binding protein EcfA2
VIVNKLAYYNKKTIKNSYIDDAYHYTSYVSIAGANLSGFDVLLNQLVSSSHHQTFFAPQMPYAAKEIGMMLTYPEEQLLDTSVLFNVMNSLFTFNYTLSNTRRKAYDALNFMEIPHADFKKDPHELSLYEQRKTILASLITIDTKVLILDNPTADLSEEEKNDFLPILYNLYTTKNRTLIIINEHADELVNFSDQIIGFKDGELKYLGKANEAAHRPSPLTSEEENALHELIFNAEIDL